VKEGLLESSFLSFAEFEAVYWALAVLAWPRDLVLKV